MEYIIDHDISVIHAIEHVISMHTKIYTPIALRT